MTEPFALTHDPGNYQTLVARLDIFDETIVYTRFDNGRPAVCHEVSPYDLGTAFTGLPVTTGLLPAGCLFYGRQGGEERAGLFLEAAHRLLTVARDGAQPLHVTLPCPPLVFVGHGASLQVFAVKQRPGQDDRLFHAPFPNVGTDGDICKGNAEFPACTAAAMRQAVNTFFDSHFNDHLVNEKSKAHPKNVLALWQELDGQETYPLDDLKPTGHLCSYLLRGEQ